MAEKLATDARQRLSRLFKQMSPGDHNYTDVRNLLDCYMVVTGETAVDAEAVIPDALRERYNERMSETTAKNPTKMAMRCTTANIHRVYGYYPSSSSKGSKWFWVTTWMPLLDAVAEQYIAQIGGQRGNTGVAITQDGTPITVNLDAPQQSEITLAPDTVCRLVGINPTLMPRARGTARRNGAEWEIEWSFPDVQRNEWPDLMSVMSQRGGWKGGGRWGNHTGSLPDTMSGGFIVSDAALNNAIVGPRREVFIPTVPQSEPIRFFSAKATPVAKPAESNDRFSNLELDPPTREDIAARDAAIAADEAKIARRKRNVKIPLVRTSASDTVDVSPDRFDLIEVDPPMTPVVTPVVVLPAPVAAPRRRVMIVDMSADADSVAILKMISRGDA